MIENNNNDIIEYPSNYKEIADMQLHNLDKEYQIVKNSEIKENKEESEDNSEQDNSYNKDNYQKLEDEEDINTIESNIPNINNNKEDKEIINNKYTLPKRNIKKSPIKLKQMISRFNIPTPNWAKNLSDEDFIQKIKEIYKSNNKPNNK